MAAKAKIFAVRVSVATSANPWFREPSTPYISLTRTCF